MTFVFPTFEDPLLEGVFLCLAELMWMIGWRHDLVLVVIKDAVDQFTLFEVAWDDGAEAVVVFIGSLGGVEPETGFSGAFIDTMAIKAGVGEDGTDVPVKVKFAIGRANEGQESEEKLSTSGHFFDTSGVG